MTSPRTLAILLALLALVTQGCGGSSHSSSSQSPGGSPGGAAALKAEANSAATGDIPDNQVFLTYRNRQAGYRLSYPEGWAQKGANTDVTLSDKNNIVHIVIDTAGAPTPAGVAAELARLKARNPTLKFSTPKFVQLKNGRAIKAAYTTRSTPNPVTGKVSVLAVERYELSNGRKRATVDLATPLGVDNIDAYRMMINSFRWQ